MYVFPAWTPFWLFQKVWYRTIQMCLLGVVVQRFRRNGTAKEGLAGLSVKAWRIFKIQHAAHSRQLFKAILQVKRQIERKLEPRVLVASLLKALQHWVLASGSTGQIKQAYFFDNPLK